VTARALPAVVRGTPKASPPGVTIADAEAAAQEGLQGLLPAGHLALSWVAVVEVAGPDGLRYIAHRAGGGHDGDSAPTAWAALGMLTAGAAVAEAQVLSGTSAAGQEESEEGEAT
jgi:hypothetical protein